MKKMTMLHEYAQHLLTLPDVEIVVEVTVMEKKPGAPADIKDFGARVKFIAEHDTDNEGHKYAMEGWQVVPPTY
jgi:hypothetical protein